MRFIFTTLLLLNILWLCADDVIVIDLPQADTLALTPVAQFQLEAINESSAAVHSRQYDTVFWNPQRQRRRSPHLSLRAGRKRLRPRMD